MDLSFKENGFKDRDMDEVCLSHKMGQDMMDFGNLINGMALEGLLEVMEMFIKAIGSMVKVTDSVYLRTVKVIDMKENGKMMHSMAREKNHFLPVNMKDNLQMAKRTDSGSFKLRMMAHMKVNF